jgi:hypothetical protein
MALLCPGGVADSPLGFKHVGLRLRAFQFLIEFVTEFELTNQRALSNKHKARTIPTSRK